MDDQYLRSLDDRLARIEEHVSIIRAELSGIKVRITMICSAIAAAVSLAASWLLK